MTEALLAKIERHCSETGIAETTFGLRAVNDGKIVPRLRAGKNVTINTIRKLEEAMEPHAVDGANPAPEHQPVPQVPDVAGIAGRPPAVPAGEGA